MATSNLGIVELTPNQTGKTVTINDAFEQIDNAGNKPLAVVLSGNAATVSGANFTKNRCFSVSGHTGTGTLTVPATPREFSVINESGSHATTVTSGGTTVSVGAGQTAIIQGDGTDLTAMGGGSTGGGGGGTVTSITAGAGLTGGTITGSGTIALGAIIGNSTDGGVTATGSNQAGAYLISKAMTIFGTVAASTGGRLPTWAADKVYVVLNRGANVLTLYPDSGSAIEGYGTNTGVPIPVGGGALLIADTTGLWRAY